MNIQQIGEFDGNIISTVLRNRGLENIELFLNPTDDDNLDSSKLRNIEQAAKVLVAHLLIDDIIGILVDPDADGYTSASVIYQYIKKINPDAKIVLFFHEEKTHGITDDILSQVLDSSIDLLIVPDAGSNDDENIKKLFYSGIETIIIDHHEIDKYPSEGILVNNQDDKNEETNKNLVGVGMVYKFCEQLDTLFENKYAQEFFDLIAIGQIGDSSDISQNEVRNYVFKGLNQIKNPFVKLVLEDHFGTSENLTPMDLSFSIIPLINAIVRVGTMEDKYLLFRALNSIDDDEIWTVEKKKKNKETGKFDKFIVEQNLYEFAYDRCKKVKTSQATLVKKALATFVEDDTEQGGIYIGILPSDVKGTITGLVANKISQKYKKPAIIVRKIEKVEAADNEEDKKVSVKFIGSGRGFEKVIPSLKDWCNETELTEFSQGHANAFGIGILEENFEEFIQKTFGVDGSNEIIHLVDYISKGKVQKEIIEEIVENRVLFGGKVNEPILAFTNIKVRKDFISQRGSMLTFFENGIEFVMFNAPNGLFEDLTYNFDSYIEMDFVGTASKTEYSGRERLRIILEDCARSEVIENEIPEKVTVDNIYF